MSERNIAAVKRLYELFAAGDISGIIDAQSADTVWDHSGPPGNPLNRVFRGRAGAKEFFEILSQTQDVVDFKADEFFGSGDRVVALGFMRLRVKSTGKEWKSDWATAWTLKDGLVTHWRPIFDMSAEAAAFQQ
jgi:ketosteroid isomerase-like protein